MAQAEGQQHPLGIYFKIWTLLFVLSAASYMVDYLQFVGWLRWFLIIIFMLLKAGLIVAVKIAHTVSGIRISVMPRVLA